MNTVVQEVREEKQEAGQRRGWLKKLDERLEAYDSERTPFVPLYIAFAWYALVIVGAATRPLWHDELYTYYIAKSPTLAGFINAVTHLDLQPPLGYVLSRISMKALGENAFTARLPSMIAFAVASLCLYQVVRRRLGRFYGLAAMLVLWLSPFFFYAAEARPYALVLGFLCLAILGWEVAIDGHKRGLALVAIAIGVGGMIASHGFSPILVAILGFAELVRTVERRRLDWLVWIAMVAPSPLVVLYRPMFRRFEGLSALPPEFQASFFKIFDFYGELLAAVGPVLLIALMVALLMYRAGETNRRPSEPGLGKHEAALISGLLLLPVLINLLLMRSGGAFWPRYCLATAVGFSFLSIYVLAKLTNASRAAAGIVAGCVFVGMVAVMAVGIARPHDRAVVRGISLKELDAQVPIVDASGLTFLEMNNREDAALLSRVYYLTDRDAAIRYAHATIFEGTQVLKDYWGLRGTVMPYTDFVRNTPHFFVLGTPDYPEDWLIPKLMDDGAGLNFVGELHGSYRDHMIFEVKMAERSGGSHY